MRYDVYKTKFGAVIYKVERQHRGNYKKPYNATYIGTYSYWITAWWVALAVDLRLL